MTNVAEPILQAQELAGGKDVCLQRAEIKEKAQAVQYQIYQSHGNRMGHAVPASPYLLCTPLPVS